MTPVGAFPVGRQPSIEEIRARGDRLAVLRLDPVTDSEAPTAGVMR